MSHVSDKVVVWLYEHVYYPSNELFIAMDLSSNSVKKTVVLTQALRLRLHPASGKLSGPSVPCIRPPHPFPLYI